MSRLRWGVRVCVWGGVRANSRVCERICGGQRRGELGIRHRRGLETAGTSCGKWKSPLSCPRARPGWAGGSRAAPPRPGPDRPLLPPLRVRVRARACGGGGGGQSLPLTNIPSLRASRNRPTRVGGGGEGPSGSSSQSVAPGGDGAIHKNK